MEDKKEIYNIIEDAKKLDVNLSYHEALKVHVLEVCEYVIKHNVGIDKERAKKLFLKISGEPYNDNI